MWFFALVVVLLIGAVAVVASGRWGAMSEAYDDRPDVLVPARHALTADDIESSRFAVGVRGYRMDEVDTLLERVAREVAERDRRIADLERAVTPIVDGPDGAGFTSPPRYAPNVPLTYADDPYGEEERLATDTDRPVVEFPEDRGAEPVDVNPATGASPRPGPDGEPAEHRSAEAVNEAALTEGIGETGAAPAGAVDETGAAPTGAVDETGAAPASAKGTHARNGALNAASSQADELAATADNRSAPSAENGLESREQQGAAPGAGAARRPAR
ncbi:MAG TPA: DivIVA domain-containing protein [Kribbella sp.]|nr:DivIVA domain-containing protein [Kribbella sp.]